MNHILPPRLRPITKIKNAGYELSVSGGTLTRGRVERSFCRRGSAIISASHATTNNRWRVTSSHYCTSSFWR